MNSPQIFPSTPEADDERMSNTPKLSPNNENYPELEQQVFANLQKPNVPNINTPERIIICIDVCCDSNNSLYELGDGTTYTPINMLKRILDFFIYSKHAINRRTQFALIILDNNDAYWTLNFTSNLREIFNVIEQLKPEQCTSDSFDFNKIINIVKENVSIPAVKYEGCTIPPYVVRMIVIYGRSTCMPLLPLDNEYYQSLKKHLHFYTDILFTHEENCNLYKCEEIYLMLQEMDNGYSYVYEVSRNAVKIHNCIAKLLAHPFQRSLQKNTDYSFGPT